MSSPYSLYVQLNDSLAAFNWIGWDIDTFILHYPDADNKMLAVKSLAYNTEKVCNDWHAFENVVCAFNNMHQANVLHIEEICYGIKQIKLIAKAIHPEQIVIFTGDIPNYIAACGVYYDWTVLPPMLSFAQELLQTVSKHTDFTMTPEIQNRIEGCDKYDPELVDADN